MLLYLNLVASLRHIGQSNFNGHKNSQLWFLATKDLIEHRKRTTLVIFELFCG